MNLLKILLPLCLSVSLFNLQAQTHTFLAEIDLGMGYFEGSDKTSYDIFFRNYNVKVFKAKGNDYSTQIKNARLVPKEDWYPNFNGESRKVELIIEVPDSLLSETKKKVDLIGGIDIFCQLWSKKSKTQKATIKHSIAWNKDATTRNTYINKNTFKVSNPIKIAYPAEIGLNLSLEYLKTALDSTADDIPQLKYTVIELEQLLKKPKDSIDLSNFQFNSFSKLLLFLEPYILENSFFNKEARELYHNVQELKDSLNILKKSEKYNSVIIDSISQEINSGLEVFSDYERTIIRIRNYYNTLQVILYGRQYNLNRALNASVSTINASISTSNASVSTSNGYNNLHFAFGSSVSLGFHPLYNVTLSLGDTVKLETVSKINTILSAGLFWSPQPYSKKAMNKDTNSDTLRRSALFSIGLMLNYTIIPNNSQLPGSNPLGMGLAVGFKTQNLGFYFMGNLKLVRQPRQYFIDQYINNNINLKSLDINDDQIFINSTSFTVGISIMYFINAKKK